MTSSNSNNSEKLMANRTKLLQNGRKPIQIGKHPTSYMYWSRGGQENLNGVYKDKYGETILCMHLSSARLLDKWKNNKKRHYHKSFNKLTNIPFLKDNITDNQKLEYKADIYLLFLKKDIGKKLSSLSHKMAPNTYTRILFNTNNHVMAITITKYSDSSLRITFYDPNDTKRHLQLRFSHAEHIKELTLKHLLSDEDIDTYFPDNSNGYFAIYNKDLLENNPTESKFICPKNIPIADKFYHALYLLNFKAAQEALNSAAKRITNEEKYFQFLFPKLDGHPLFLVSLSKGADSHFIQLYANAILESWISLEKKLDILSPKFFYHLLKNSDISGVKLFLDTIINKSSFSREHINNILSGAKIEHFSDAENRHDILTLFTQSILKLNNQSEFHADKIINFFRNCDNEGFFNTHMQCFIATGIIPLRYDIFISLNSNLISPVISAFRSFGSFFSLDKSFDKNVNQEKMIINTSKSSRHEFKF